MTDHTDGGSPDESREPAPEFVVVDDSDEADFAREAQAAEPESRPITAARVRQLSALRRGAYRTRSYLVVAIAACAVAEGKLALMTVRHVRAFGWQPRALGYVCGIIAAMMAAAYFLRRAAEVTRELRTRPSEPEAAPDLSTLSDGSHAWKN